MINGNNNGRASRLAHIIRREDMQLSALLLLVSIRIGLWVFPFRWMQTLGSRASDRSISSRSSSTFQTESIPALMQVIQRVARWVPAATCLTQALSAQILLARGGHRSVLRIGVIRGSTSGIKAHAWIEKDGRIVIGGDVPGMSEFRPLPVK
jgi:hypothetical protein